MQRVGTMRVFQPPGSGDFAVAAGSRCLKLRRDSHRDMMTRSENTWVPKLFMVANADACFVTLFLAEKVDGGRCNLR